MTMRLYIYSQTYATKTSVFNLIATNNFFYYVLCVGYLDPVLGNVCIVYSTVYKSCTQYRDGTNFRER